MEKDYLYFDKYPNFSSNVSFIFFNAEERKAKSNCCKIEKRVESIYNIIAEHALLRFCNLYAESNHFVREIRETKGKKEREKEKKIECCEYSRASCIISRLRG